jgi:hypothetical protein
MAGAQAGDNLAPEFVMIPAEIVERVERDRARRRRYEASHPKRNKNSGRIKNADRPFIGWDGEGPRDAGYALFGSSAGDEICHPYLGTEECLNLILDREREEPDAIHIWFGSNYDVSMILRELPWRAFSALKHYTQTVWHDYDIEHIPHKWLKITKDGVTAKIYDIQSFLGGSYVSALITMGIGTDDEIAHLTSEKSRRSEFLFSEIGEIADYWRLELRLMPLLAEAYRRAFTDAGFDVRSWHGPGALANMAMRRHGVFDAMAETPQQVRKAARFAFAGGRFEMFRGGWIRKPIFNADINSAYPAYARLLPNLSRGNWRTGRYYEAGKFAVYHIEYNAPFDPLIPYPLFRRLETGEVIWSNKCDGWYWGPEAELVSEDPCARFIESYVFDEDDSMDRPFAWIEDYYHKRKRLKNLGSPLELTFKLIINSVYGQLAQRTGWDKRKRTAPKSHQLEWAGFITSACRAAIFRAAISAGPDLVSIDTDGIYATRHIGNLDYGTSLGQWESDEFREGIFFQSGIYSLKTEFCREKTCDNHAGSSERCSHQWAKGKTRGIPKGRYSAEDLISAVENNTPLCLLKNQFIGYGLALNGQEERLNTWVQVPVEIVMGGTGKRYHNTARWCGVAGGCPDGIHEFIPRPVRWNPEDTTASEAHFLPWLANDELMEGKKRNHDDITIYDTRHLDEDDEWIRSYALNNP